MSSDDREPEEDRPRGTKEDVSRPKMSEPADPAPEEQTTAESEGPWAAGEPAANDETGRPEAPADVDEADLEDREESTEAAETAWAPAEAEEEPPDVRMEPAVVPPERREAPSRAPEPEPSWDVVESTDWPSAEPPRTEPQPERERASVAATETHYLERAEVAGSSVGRTFGWLLTLAGAALITYALYWTYINDTDEISSAVWAGAALAFVGLIVATIFFFAPGNRAHGPPPSEGSGAFERRADSLRKRVAVWKATSAVGFGLLLVGVLLVGLGALSAWLDRVDLAETGFDAAGYFVRTHLAGAAIAGLGFVLFVLTFPRISGEQEAERAYLLAEVVQERAEELPPAPAGSLEPRLEHAARQAVPAARPAAGLDVDPEKVKALMRKIDALLAHLPEDQVSDFARSDEADTYLKLLEKK
jgi:uncharacterized MAPEG superfamily protein